MLLGHHNPEKEKDMLKIISCILFLLTLNSTARSETTPVDEILKATNFRGGMIVYIGEPDIDTLASFRINNQVLIHVLVNGDIDDKRNNVDNARRAINAKGLYGIMSAIEWNGDKLPYADNLVNLIIAASHKLQVTGEEIMRVLAPRGAVLIKENLQPANFDLQHLPGIKGWIMSKKPVPPDIDDWTHFLKNPDNNSVSQDTVVGPPKYLQWRASPDYDRHHEFTPNFCSINSDDGIIFAIMTEAPIQNHLIPPIWILVARDAFNGLELWRRKISSWDNYLCYFRSISPQSPRRIVAVNGKVFVTLGFGEPVSVLNAGTGETLNVLKHTDNTEEIIHYDNKLFLVIRDRRKDLKGTQHCNGKGKYVAPIPGRIQLVDSKTGDIVWKRNDPEIADVLPLGTAIKNSRVILKTTRTMLALDFKTGKTIWNTNCGMKEPVVTFPERPTKNRLLLSDEINSPAPKLWYVSTVVAGDNVVVCTDDVNIYGLNMETGRILWKKNEALVQGFFSPPDVLFVDGKFWVSAKPKELTKDKGTKLVAYEPLSGKEVDTAYATRIAMAHHRCYRRRATPRYMISSEAGCEMFEFSTRKEYIENWIRGGCQSGLFPCNGLLYATPSPCACYVNTRVNGFLAIAAEQSIDAREPSNKLIHGALYGKINNSKQDAAEAKAWPIYRHDIQRSGSTPAIIPATLSKKWKVQLGPRISSTTIKDGHVYLAEIDRHTVHCLDQTDGKTLWSFTADARVDTPPTICGNLAVFGCRNGWVYCLSVETGGLVWKFRVAPHDRLMMAYGQLESTWPVFGSLPVIDNVVYCTAGTSTFAADGVFVCGLDLVTGKALSKNRIVAPKDNGKPIAFGHNFRIIGSANDLLVSDGNMIYMRDTVMDKNCRLLQTYGNPRLMASGLSLLDDSWFHRSFWFMDTLTQHSSHFACDLMVFDKNRQCRVTSYSAGRTNEANPCDGYILSSYPLTKHTSRHDPKPKKGEKEEKPQKTRPPKPHWVKLIQVNVKAMVLGNIESDSPMLAIAGPPVIKDFQGFEKAIKGEKGGVFQLLLAGNGKELCKLSLDSPPVFDGMSAVDGNIFISLINGQVICIGNNE
jgi:outer membrane protein assembly factor BamB